MKLAHWQVNACRRVPLRAGIGGLWVACLMWLPFLPVRAEDNTSLIIIGPTTTNISGPLVVGNTGTNNSLQIYNGGAVTDTTATVGNAVAASNNYVVESDTGSVWNSSGTFYLGYNGGGNSLTISNGALVNALGSFTAVGYLSTASGNNTVLVSGSGSVWSNSNYILVGDTGGNNQITVANGGRIDVLFAEIGISDTNTLLVTGPGSLFSLPTSSFEFGTGGRYNLATIANGGQVVDADGYIGIGGVAGSNNTVVVNAGLWTNSSSLNIGYSSPNSQLIVTNGGKVYDNAASFLGGNNFGQTNAGNNSVLVSDPGSLWASSGNLGIGKWAGNNTLTVSNGGDVVVAGNVIVAVNGALSGSNTVLVTGAGSVLSNTSYITFGQSGGNNQMIIADGGRVDAQYLALGATDNNSLLVTGTNSVFSIPTSSFEIGVGGRYNTATISDGAQVIDSTAYIGIGGLAGSNNTVVVNGGLWTNSGDVYVGYDSPGSQLVVSNGSRVYSVTGGMGFNSTNSYGNTAIVTGSNSLWVVTDPNNGLTVGKRGSSNQLVIANGAIVTATRGLVGGWYGADGSASGNSALVTDSGSLWTNTDSSYGVSLGIGAANNNNSLVVSNGGRIVSPVGFVGVGGVGNTALVTGSNSVWSMTSSVEIGVNAGANGNSLTVSQGGQISFVGAYIGNGGSSNLLVVTDPGSAANGAANYIYVGYTGSGNSLIVSNGGRITDIRGYVGAQSSSTGNSAVITGGGSLWQNSDKVYVGTNATSDGGGSVLVTDGGTIESIGLVGGLNGSGTISNLGGVYQFTTANPTISPNTAGSIVVSNGAIAFRGIANADVFSDTGAGPLAPIAFEGNNAFRLNNASNTTSAAQDYTFDTGRGATNYSGLELVNAGSLWRSANLTIGTGGTFLASNTVGTVAALVTNLGSIVVSHSTMTWASNIVVQGSYKSDPSTNIFQGDATVALGGALAGGPGDVFNFNKSLFIQSTNRLGFQLQLSDVQFSGGVAHTNTITGADLGGGVAAYGAAFETATNFAYGGLHLGSTGDTIQFSTGNAQVSNALYVDWVDLLGSTNYVANLSAPTGIDVYYLAYDPRNAYLRDLTYQLNGGGFLLPVIPEPGVAALLGVGGMLLWRRRKCPN